MENMMKSILKTIAVCILILLPLLSGCELVTEGPGNTNRGLGQDLIINEIFTISPDKYYAYSWIELFNPTNARIRTYQVTYPATGYAVGASGTILYSTDDGSQWASLPGVPSAKITSIDNAYPDTGFACGDGGIIFRTIRDTAGIRFVNLPSPTTNNLRDIVFNPLSPTGYIAGEHGTILRTTQRGNSWTVQNSTTGQNLNAIFFIGFNAVYVVGDSGTVMKSPSNNKWDNKSPGQAYQMTNFYNLYFVADTGWIVGDNGKVLITENGAGSWTPETTGTTAGFHGVFFSPRATGFRSGQGWVVGDSGIVLRTENSGKTKWLKSYGPTGATLRSVVFVDSLRGWAAGDGGVIINTTNAGRTWNLQSTNTNENLMATMFLPLLIEVDNDYILLMRVQRNKLFWDQRQGGEQTFNPDVVTKVDTGDVVFIIGQDLSQQNRNTIPSIPAGGFGIISSDSAKFQDHIKLGPGERTIFNFTFSFGMDISNGDTTVAIYKWMLLPSTEISLYKEFQRKTRVYPPKILASYVQLLDVVRFGYYRPAIDNLPQNAPQTYIPEGWSLARYSNDINVDPRTESTMKSFYLAKDPIPSWYSQQRR